MLPFEVPPVVRTLDHPSIGHEISATNLNIAFEFGRSRPASSILGGPYVSRPLNEELYVPRPKDNPPAINEQERQAIIASLNKFRLFFVLAGDGGICGQTVVEVTSKDLAQAQHPLIFEKPIVAAYLVQTRPEMHGKVDLDLISKQISGHQDRSDSLGNILVFSSGMPSLPGVKGIVDYCLIMPPLAVVSEDIDKQSVLPFAFECHEEFTQTIKDIFWQPVITPVRTDSSYTFYSRSKEWQAQELGEAMRGATLGLNQATTFLGLSEQKRIQNVLFVDDGNSFFIPASPNSVVLMLSEGVDANSLQNIARHEGFHSFDDLLDHHVSTGSFYAIWSRERQAGHAKLLETISESNYSSIAKEQGHASASPSELFASFLNSFFVDDWAGHMRKAKNNERELYLELLMALKHELSELPIIPASAPVFEEIKRREQLLRKN